MFFVLLRDIGNFWPFREANTRTNLLLKYFTELRKFKNAHFTHLLGRVAEKSTLERGGL